MDLTDAYDAAVLLPVLTKTRRDLLAQDGTLRVLGLAVPELLAPFRRTTRRSVLRVRHGPEPGLPPLDRVNSHVGGPGAGSGRCLQGSRPGSVRRALTRRILPRSSPAGPLRSPG